MQSTLWRATAPVQSAAIPRAWAPYLRRVSAAIRRQRIAARRDRLQKFGEKDDYEDRADLKEMDKPGRTRLLLFEEAWKRLLRCLYEREGKILSEDQEQLAKEMRNAMLIKFYGSLGEVQKDITWLRANYGLTGEVYNTVAVLYPRRHGKTLVQALVSATVLVSQLGGNVMAYNYTGNHAKTWYDLCYKYLGYMRTDSRFGWHEEARSGNKLIIAQTINNGRLAKLWVFGNASDGRKATSLRGTGEDAFLINLDEFAFFHDEAFKVIFPAAANGAALVLTSSRPPFKTTALDLLEEVTDTGRAAVHKLDWRRLCPICRDMEQKTGRAIDECSHTVRAPIHFRSFLDTKRVISLLKPFGDAGRTEMQNETMGAIPIPLFDAVWIERALGRLAPRVSTMSLSNHFFTGFDPGSPQHKSDTAIMSVGFVRHVAGDDGHYREFGDDTPLFNGQLVVCLAPPSLSSLLSPLALAGVALGCEVERRGDRRCRVNRGRTQMRTRAQTCPHPHSRGQQRHRAMG